jgi:hypothetical protein
VDLASFDELEQAQIFAHEMRQQAHDRAQIAAVVFSSCSDLERAKGIYSVVMKAMGHSTGIADEVVDGYLRDMDKQYNIHTAGGQARLDIKENE